METKGTEKPPEEEADSPLVSDGEGAVDWRSNSYTRRVCAGQVRRYVAFMKELQRMGMVSTDPKIAAKAHQIAELSVQIIVMGGKLG